MRTGQFARPLPGLAMAAMAVLLSARPAWAQGCIVARSPSHQLMGPATGPESPSGLFDSGEGSLTVGYRHQFSFRHFVGSTEQTYRMQQGTQVMNKINLQDYNLTYQATPRWSFSIDVPVLFASRRSN